MTAQPIPPAKRATLTRRTFMRKAGLGVAAAATSAVLADTRLAAAASQEPAADDLATGILIDLTRCTGCQSCALACKVANRRPQPETVPEKLDSGAYSYVADYRPGDGNTYYVKRQCMNCLHPACASACTVGALRKTPEGPVVYDAGKCIGCRYCQYACPFGVPSYEWNNVFGLIGKCQMCVRRLAVGELPACVASCPNGALRYGLRHELLAQARARIASNPGNYLDQIYGEHEAGGTSMLYLSAVPFTALGFPALGSQPIAHEAENAMSLTPAVALTVASLATGLHLLLRRRHQTADFTVRDEKSGCE